jgi:hypothetical protein
VDEKMFISEMVDVILKNLCNFCRCKRWRLKSYLEPHFGLSCKHFFLKITLMSVMYLDFIDGKVVHPYFVLFQVMGVDPSLKMYQLVDFVYHNFHEHVILTYK